ncbi:FecR family protein [Flavitalea flava]
MQPGQQLIDRFYRGTCTPEEAKLVMDWMLEKERGSSGDAEWTEISPVGNYPENYPVEMLAFIEANHSKKTDDIPHKPGDRQSASDEGQRMIPFHFPALRWAMAAACLLLFAGLSIVIWNKSKRTLAVNPAIAVNVETPPAKIQRLASFNAPVKRPSTIRLADGSTVILSPGSTLRYDSLAYDQNDRVLFLEGKAVFSVAPQKNKPFRVNANGFSTTALGTRFMVATRTAGAIQVRLYSGKVVVRYTGTPTKPMQDFYLQPGDELVYDSKMRQSVVSRFESLNEKAGLATRTRKDIKMSGDTLVFDNAPLADVLDLLHKRYHVAIQYNKSILSDAWFTGQLLPQDPIELILKTVTRINKLTLIAADDGFIIR